VVTLLVGLAVAVGLIGTLLPILPGLALIWAATVAYGLLEGFGAIGWAAITLITGLLVGGVATGIRIPQKAAAAGDIGWTGQAFAVGLAVAGFFVIPVVGAAVGFVAGVYLAAWRRNREAAWSTTVRTLRALFMAAGVQFVTGIAMAVTWGAWVILG
jgi:uncharacterized protein